MREELFSHVVNVSPVIPSVVERIPWRYLTLSPRDPSTPKAFGLRMTRGCGPTDPTAADYNVAIVNYRGLTRSDRALRVVQTQFGRDHFPTASQSQPFRDDYSES